MCARMTALKLLPEIAMTVLAVGSWVVLVFQLPEGQPPAANGATVKSLGVTREGRSIGAPMARASEPNATRSGTPAQVTLNGR